MAHEWHETPYARLRLREDGVAEIRHADGVHHTLAIAEAQVHEFAEMLGEGTKAPLLVVVGRDFRQDEDARELLLRGPLVGRTFTRGALVLGSRLEQTAVALFLRVQRTVIPIRAFRDEQKALRWLRGG